MRKNRLLLIVNVSVIALSSLAYAQDVIEAISSDDITKQQLEQFLTPKEETFETQETILLAADEPAVKPADKEIKQAVASKTEEVKKKTESDQKAAALEAAQAKTAPKEEVKQPEKPKEAVKPAAVPEAKSEEVKKPVGSETKPTGAPEAAPAKEEAKQHEKPKEEVKPAPAPQEKVAEVKPAVKPEEKKTVEHKEEAPAHKEEPAHKEALSPVKEKKEEESLLDTLDIEEGGNWVLKAKALNDTMRKIEDINALYDDIRDTNVVFLQGINTVDVLFTQFTYEVGLDLGRVDQLVQDVENHLAQERQAEGDLSEEERELLHKAEERKKEIEQLRGNIKDILQAHAQLKEARSLNEEQIIESDRRRKDAWRNFRMIQRVLNEEKAEELYHETVQLFEIMQSTYRYLQTRLIPHFQQSIKTIQEKIQEVKKQADQLQQQGILLKKEAIDLDRKEHEKLHEKEVHVEEPVAQPVGWLGSIKNMLWAPFSALGSLWNWITGSSENMNKYLPDEVQTEEPVVKETQHPEEL